MAGLQTKEVVLGDSVFEFTTLTATKARRLHLLIAKTLAPSVGVLMKAVSGGKVASVGDLDIEDLSSCLESISDEALDTVVDLLASSCIIKSGGKQLQVKAAYDIFFAGKPMLHWQWVIEGVKFNLYDFLDALGATSLQNQRASE